MRLLLIGTCLAGLTTGVLWSADDAKPPERLDALLREEFFAGFRGDDEALARGFKKCEEVLDKNPKRAEALVWRGAGRVFQSGQLFQSKKLGEAMMLWSTGMKDLDDAVALAPNSVAVRIPRAAVLVPASRNAPAAMGKPLLTKALDDFQTIYKLQEKDLSKLGTHPRGELRMGMADVYRMLGQLDKSREQLEAVTAELPDSKYAERAKEWLAAKPDAKLEHTCIGCHKKK